VRLLLIRPGALGDTLLTFPVIEALRASSPHPYVILVGNRAVLPLARTFGLAEETFDYEEPRWSGLFVTSSSNPGTGNVNKHINPNIHPPAGTDLSRPGYGLQGGSPDAINRSLRGMLSGFDRAIAWLRDPDNVVYSNLQAAGIAQITVVPGRPSDQERIHIVDYLAHSVGVSTNPHPCYGDDFCVTGNILAQEPAFAIHPGSGGARKCWPPEHFAAVIRWLWQHNQTVLLLSGPADHERLEVLLKLLPTPPRPALLKLLVDVPLLDLVPILCRCRGYLGNDAGMTHLAALLGLPTLVLFGPTDPLIWQPHGRAVRVIHEPDLEQLEVGKVIDLIEFR
jgi:heptosyltransferase-3